jgi:hypothetical protein
MLPANALVPETVKAVLLSVTERVPAPESLRPASVCAALVNATVPLALRFVPLLSAPATLKVVPLSTSIVVLLSDAPLGSVSVPASTFSVPVNVLAPPSVSVLAPALLTVMAVPPSGALIVPACAVVIVEPFESVSVVPPTVYPVALKSMLTTITVPETVMADVPPVALKLASSPALLPNGSPAATGVGDVLPELRTGAPRAGAEVKAVTVAAVPIAFRGQGWRGDRD